MNKRKILNLIFAITFIIISVTTSCITSFRLIDFYFDNVKQELIYYNLLEYLVDNFESDSNFKHNPSIFQLDDYKKNAEAQNNLLLKNNIDVSIINEELINDFNKMIEGTNFDVSAYSKGKLINLYNSNSTSEKQIFGAFSVILRDLSDKYGDMLTFEDYIEKTRFEVRKYALTNIVIVIILISAYYLTKLLVEERQLKMSASDKIILICIIMVFIITGIRFYNISTQLITYSSFFEHVQDIDIITRNPIELIYNIYFKFLYSFLQNYIYEFSVCFVLMITIGEFTYARSVYKNEAMVIASLFINALDF